MNAHTLGITHPAVGGFRFRKLTVYGLLSGEDPRVAAGNVGTENVPREGVKHHGSVGPLMGMTQALLAEIRHDIDPGVHQRQRSRTG